MKADKVKSLPNHLAIQQGKSLIVKRFGVEDLVCYVSLDIIDFTFDPANPSIVFILDDAQITVVETNDLKLTCNPLGRIVL